MESQHIIQTSVDPVLFSVFDGSLQVLLVKRNIEPYQGCWSLPGGLIDINKDNNTDDAALRKLKEKTGVSTPYLERVDAIGGLGRDPRGWALTVVYCALVPKPEVELTAVHGADEVAWFPVTAGAPAVPLAFDHGKLIALALERLRSKVSYTSIATQLLPEQFNFRELQELHELVLGRLLDRKTLMRRYLDAELLEPVQESAGPRPKEGQQYRLKDRQGVHIFTRALEGPWKR